MPEKNQNVFLPSTKTYFLWELRFFLWYSYDVKNMFFRFMMFSGCFEHSIRPNEAANEKINVAWIYEFIARKYQIYFWYTMSIFQYRDFIPSRNFLLQLYIQSNAKKIFQLNSGSGSKHFMLNLTRSTCTFYVLFSSFSITKIQLHERRGKVNISFKK